MDVGENKHRVIFFGRSCLCSEAFEILRSAKSISEMADSSDILTPKTDIEKIAFGLKDAMSRVGIAAADAADSFRGLAEILTKE